MRKHKLNKAQKEQKEGEDCLPSTDIHDEKDRKPITDNKKKSAKKKKSNWYAWPIKAFFLTLLLSAVFSIVSELVISVSNIIIVYLVLFLLICINVFFDIIGLAFASCDVTPFYSLASKKVRGAKMSLALLKRADVVSSICSDVIGDICGIVSGAAGAAIVVKMALTGETAVLIASIIVSSLISALTVGGKAFEKKVAIKHAQKIVGNVGSVLSIFSKSK